MAPLPSERTPWLVRRAGYRVLVIRAGSGPVYDHPGEHVVVASPCYPLCGVGFDLVVVPAAVQREYRQWVEETVSCHLNDGGQMIIVEGT